MRSFPFTGGAARVPMRGPLSQILELQGVGTEKMLAWEPEDRRQMPIEVRARIIATNLPIGLVPVVRWSLETAHGDAVWPEPFPALEQIAGTPFQDYSLPARGFCFRTNAREFRIRFRNDGTLTGAPMDRCVVQVTILPCAGQEEPRYPREHTTGAVVGGVLQPFPVNATEWQVSDFDGTPITGPGGVVFTGIAGALFGPVVWAALNPWLPIPHDAVGWVPTVPVLAQYR